MPFECPEIYHPTTQKWAPCCNDGKATEGRFHNSWCPWLNQSVESHWQRRIWKEEKMKHRFASSVEEVLDAALYQTPLKGDDLAQKVVRGVFLHSGFPTVMGVELLNSYNASVRHLNDEERGQREMEANATSAARLLGRPDLKDAIVQLLKRNPEVR